MYIIIIKKEAQWNIINVYSADLQSDEYDSV